MWYVQINIYDLFSSLTWLLKGTFKVGTFNFYMVTLLVYMDLCHQIAYKVTIDIITMVRTPLLLLLYKLLHHCFGRWVGGEFGGGSR